MKIATWNVNSIKARKERLLDWLTRHSPDVLCLQELKLEAAAFPADDIRSAGYHAVMFGQKTYNGVAILSREPATEVRLGFDDPEIDVQSRVISARIGELQVISAYVPNGAEVSDPKYAYKLSWLERFAAYLQQTCAADRPIALCGDFNIAPDDRDVRNVEQWKDSVYCTPEVRAAYGELLAAAEFRDCFRLRHAEGGFYTWWDYRRLAFPKNDGIRIDHVLATPPLAARCTGAEIDREQRKGKLPSDHAPVIAEFA